MPIFYPPPAQLSGQDILDMLNTGSNHLLRDIYGNTQMDWTAGDLFYYGTPVVRWTLGTLLANTGYQSLDWWNRILNDYYGSQALNWNSRQLISNSGYVALDWGNRQLDAEYGVLAVDWYGRRLYGSSGYPSLDWENRQLLDYYGNQIMNWMWSGSVSINSNVQFTGNPAFDLGGNPIYSNWSEAFRADWQGVHIGAGYGALSFFSASPAGQQPGRYDVSGSASGSFYSSYPTDAATFNDLINAVNMCLQALRAYGLMAQPV